ncbi:hypothetical protein [Phaeovulum sp. W22_SRMD_FR3]|uniref:hypothetical protein n=1 Tax=Phaeovulum sp. W22_SRMD_FR3 TaxID=3240274 RepID=UPI003F95A6C0
MQRHLLDHKRLVSGGTRLRRYVELLQGQTLHPAIQSLRQRGTEKMTVQNRRAVEYMRIARGRTV